jgi:hypothetical protein
MARVLGEWPGGKSEYRPGRHYDWDRFLDGRIWELDPDEWGDDQSSFRSAAYHYARKSGGRVRIKRRNSGTMVVQYLEGKIDAGND